MSDGDLVPAEDPGILLKLPENELRQLCHNTLGYWPDPACTQEQLIALLWYKSFADQLPANSLEHQRDPLRNKRREMRRYIEQYEDVLSLPCHGKCWLCHDIRVLQCYGEFEKDAAVVQINSPEEW